MKPTAVRDMCTPRDCGSGCVPQVVPARAVAGAATARASDLPWCALCLRRVAARSPAIAAALSRHPEDGDDPMNIFKEPQAGGTATPLCRFDEHAQCSTRSSWPSPTMSLRIPWVR